MAVHRSRAEDILIWAAYALGHVKNTDEKCRKHRDIY